MKADPKSILFGLVFMVLGIFFMFIFGQVAELSCTKTAAGETECSKVVKFLGVIPLSSSEFRDVYRAEVEENCDDDGCSYRVVLTSIDGERPLTSYYSSGWDSKQELAGRINAFIGSNVSGGTLSIQENSGLWASLLSLVFLLVGLYQLILKGLIQPNQAF
jgi:hypothetical protein